MNAHSLKRQQCPSGPASIATVHYLHRKPAELSLKPLLSHEHPYKGYEVIGDTTIVVGYGKYTDGREIYMLREPLPTESLAHFLESSRRPVTLPEVRTNLELSPFVQVVLPDNIEAVTLHGSGMAILRDSYSVISAVQANGRLSVELSRAGKTVKVVISRGCMLLIDGDDGEVVFC